MGVKCKFISIRATKQLWIKCRPFCLISIYFLLGDLGESLGLGLWGKKDLTRGKRA